MFILAADECGFNRLREELETFRQGGRGAAHKALLAYSKWDFTVSEVTVPSYIWLGKEDILSFLFWNSNYPHHSCSAFASLYNMGMKTILTIITLSLGTLVIGPLFADAKAADEHIFYFYPNSQGYESVRKNYRDIDILAPQIYEVTFGNQLILLDDGGVLELADDKNIDVMPLVINAAFNREHMSRFLGDFDAQDEVIDDLIKEARKYDFIGYQYDFENISHFDRQAYVDFVAKSYKEFKKKDLLFSVAVIPRTTPYDFNSANQDWSSGYDFENLGKNSDFLSVMSYDDPLSTGPVAAMSYLKKALKHIQNEVPNEKISLGVPLYCWQYEVGNSKKIANVTYSRAAATQEVYKDLGALRTYVGDDYETEVFLFIKRENDRYALNIIWCDNEQSIEVKQELAQDEKLRGLSYWAIGQEDARIWKHF